MTHRRALGIFAVSFALAGTAPATAAADILSGYAQIQGGGASGAGLFGDRQDDAFHAGAEGLTYGAIVGVEIIYLDVWVEHNQYMGSGSLEGTWTQFMTGLDIEFDLGEKVGTKRARGGRLSGGHSRYYGEFGIGVGFGVGTGQQIDPPLDNSEVTDKGFLFQANLGLGIRLGRHFSIGLTMPLQAGYMFKNGEDVGAANDISTNYGSMQGALMLTSRLKIQLK